jgi:hypothetical protein
MGNDLHTLLIGLASNIIWLPVGALLAYFIFLIRVRFPNRRLWQIKDPSRLVVCAANSTVTNTGVYGRPSTGIGQVRALALAVRSLNQAYSKSLDIQNILLSTDRLQERLENDLLILGGPKNNAVAAKFLELLAEEQPAKQLDTAIYWREQQNRTGQWLDQSATEFLGNAVKRQVVMDYGLIVRARSPFTLFSGSHTYGTIAAGKYFCDTLHRHLRSLLKGGKQNFAVLVSAHIVDGYPTKIKMERAYAW